MLHFYQNNILWNKNYVSKQSKTKEGLNWRIASCVYYILITAHFYLDTLYSSAISMLISSSRNEFQKIHRGILTGKNSYQCIWIVHNKQSLISGKSVIDKFLAWVGFKQKSEWNTTEPTWKFRLSNFTTYSVMA